MMTTVSMAVALIVAVPIAVTMAVVVYTKRILHSECGDKSGETEGKTLEQEGDQARTVGRKLGDVVAPHFVP
uniref:Putative secreted protein n=1 Tax=Anopheles darlingi TaxID=43151 RepID=A0A2M4DGU7_ANODA